MEKLDLNITNVGFDWGNVSVERLCHDKTGLYLCIMTDKQELDIKITPKGFIKPYAVNNIEE